MGKSRPNEAGTIRLDRTSNDFVRVKSIGANGEQMQNGEELESKESLRVHIAAMRRLWSGSDEDIMNRLRNNTGDERFNPDMSLVRER